MKTHLFVKDESIPLNDFTQQYIGHVLRGIAASLGFPGGSIIVHLHHNELKISSGGREVPVRKEFVRQLVTGTLHAMLSQLKGVSFSEDIRITVHDM